MGTLYPMNMQMSLKCSNWKRQLGVKTATAESRSRPFSSWLDTPIGGASKDSGRIKQTGRHLCFPLDLLFQEE